MYLNLDFAVLNNLSLKKKSKTIKSRIMLPGQNHQNRLWSGSRVAQSCFVSLKAWSLSSRGGCE